MNKHFELIDLVNDATTEDEHIAALWRLAGYRLGVEECGFKWSGIDADLHSMKRFGDERLMCCGVLLDWRAAQ